MEGEVKRYIVNVDISGTAEIEVMASSPEEAVAMAERVTPYSGKHLEECYSLNGEVVEEEYLAKVMHQELDTDCCNWVCEADGPNEWEIDDGEVIRCDDDNSN